MTLPSKATKAPKQCPQLQNRATGPFTAEVLYSSLNCPLGVQHTCTHPLLENMVKEEVSDHITCSHIPVDQCLWFLTYKWPFCLCNEGYVHCSPAVIPRYVWLWRDCSCWHSMITSCTDTFSHLRILLFLHMTSMRQHHAHWMCAFVPLRTLFPDAFLQI